MMAAFDQSKTPEGETRRAWLDVGANPPDGVVMTYLLPEAAEGTLTLTFRDAQGAEIRTIKSKKPEKDQGAKTTDDTAAREGEVASGESAVAPGESLSSSVIGPSSTEEEKDDEPKAPARAGLNRFVWDLRGRYRVELTVGEATSGADFAVLPDPRAHTTQAEYEEQYALLGRIHALLGQVHTAINTVRTVRAQLDDWTKRTAKHEAGARIAAAAKALNARLAAAEEHLIQVKIKSDQDSLNYPVMINAKLAFLAALVGSAEAGPTKAQHALFEDLEARASTHLRAIEAALTEDLPAFNTLVREAALPAVSV
jgi:hypothetical protein